MSMHYDPMIAKVSVWAPTREEAVARLRVALDEVQVEPPKKASGMASGSLRTNLSFLHRLVRDPRAIVGDTTTDLIASNPALTTTQDGALSVEAALAVALFQLTETPIDAPTDAAASAWSRVARREGVRA